MAKSLCLQSPINPHFFQPLLPGFHAHLNIPVSFFSAYIEGRIEQNKAELRSEAFDKTWKVELEGRRLTDGWEDFTVAHDFRIGDIVVLRYEGDLVFYVTAFGPRCCEIQYLQSSLIRKLTREIQVNKINPDAESSTSDDSYFIANITDSNLQVDTLFLPRRFGRSGGLKREDRRIILMNEQGRTWTANLRYRESFYIIGGWRSFCQEHGLKSGDSIRLKLENDKETPILTFLTTESNNTHQQMLISCKRKRRRSQSMSSKSSSDNRFVTLTLTTYSSKNFRLYLPMHFTRVNEMEKAGKKITLVDKHGVGWPASLLIEKGRGKMFLGKGWREFCKANEVQVEESFEMELIWEDRTWSRMASET